MKTTKKNGYVLATDLAELSKTMIAGLGKNSMVKGNRCSLYFALATDEKAPRAEALVALVENKANLEPEKYHYTVLLIDYISRDGGEAVPYPTNEMSDADLIRVLQEIWCELTERKAPEEIDKEAEFAYLKSYIQGACFDDEVSVDYLYALWIAFCLHHGLTVDKDEYQERLEELWKVLEESDGGEVVHWEDHLDFDSDMSQKLL